MCDLDTPCLLFTAMLDSEGYGVQYSRETGRYEQAHRMAYAKSIGVPMALVRDIYLRHVCGNHACINADHLTEDVEPVDVPTVEAKPLKITPAPPKTPSVDADPSSNAKKLSVEQVHAIRNSPLNGKDVAKEYGINPSTVCRLRACKIWRDVPHHTTTYKTLETPRHAA